MSKRPVRRDRTHRRRGTEPHRNRTRNFEVQVFEEPELGPDMVTADRETVLAALEDFDLDAPWDVVRHRLIPLLPRVRPLPVPIEGLVRAMLPPGVLTGFGLDCGPAVTFVDHAQLERWGIGVETAISTALANVRRMVATCDPGTVHRSTIDRMPVAIFQSRLGIASTLILVPECIERLMGPGPHLLLAPMRDILMALPVATDRGLAAWLSVEWEAIDPNCLHLGAFRYERGSITAESLEEAGARA